MLVKYFDYAAVIDLDNMLLVRVDTEFSHAIIIINDWMLFAQVLINFAYIKVHCSSHIVWHLDLKRKCEI